MSKQNIYTVGGTVQAGSGVYIPREADDKLLVLCRAGTFAYVLTARQMGKSSLMVRAAERLAEEDIISIIIDLSEFGVYIAQEEWYLGILTKITDSIELDVDVINWWKANAHLGATQRMTLFLETILLNEVSARVVIFIDEIDTTLGLPFTDDFYAAIRYIYNARAQKRTFKRLSFVLIGVATPSDLVSDPQRTPFNIGQRVELTDFNFAEAKPFADGLGLPSAESSQVLGWVMKWTGGHPYLTQRLCRVVAQNGPKSWSEEDIDRVVSDTFLGERSEQDQNLQFVRDMLIKLGPNVADVLAIYQEVRLGQRAVADEKQSVVKSHLKLSGIVRRSKAVLMVRNLLYATVFNLQWIQTQTSESPTNLLQDNKAGNSAKVTINTAARNLKVFISSTALDLPEHRREVMDACLRQGMFPMLMEHLPASDEEAIQTALAMIDQCDIYLGIFAYRYGYVPKGHEVSITEMEYDRAVERGIPCLIFMMHEDHPIKAADFETGKGEIRLSNLKDRMAAERVVSLFRTPADLRANVINSLSQYREHREIDFHYVSDIPKPPEVYIAHPYTLLQTRDLIGRQNELNLLTDWVARPGSAVYQARIFNVVAIGGMGKSALTWKWFNDIAPNEMKPLAGRMWWSFYESDANFENFIIRALAYVSGRAREDIEKNTRPGEREELLLAALDREPFLLVLDGLERILIAYARMDANRLADDDLDQQTANVVAGALGLPKSAAQSFTGQHRLRKTADPRAGNFLRKLARVRESRVLVSTRLYPADLQTVTGVSLAGSFAGFIEGLSDDDALNLWRTFGVTGSLDELLRLFHIFGSHPLLIQVLASEIAHYHRAPGDFDIWRSNHPDFDPFSLPLVQARSHILEFALRELNETAKKVLQTVAAFRMPATYDTLTALLIGEEKIFSNENELDVALMELEDRGLLGWDKRGNRYDLHPIVRGVVWSGLTDDIQRNVYMTLQKHFEALPKMEDYLQVERIEDLTPAIELYNTLIGLGRYDDAYIVFQDRISDATLYRLSASRQRVELLEMLFHDGLDQLPRLSNPPRQAFTLNEMALAYQFSGQPGRAVPLFRRDLAIVEKEGDQGNLSTGLQNLSVALRLSGAVSESQLAALQSLVIERKRGDLLSEGVSLQELGLILAVRGPVDEAERSVQRALRIWSIQENRQGEGVGNAYMAQLILWKAEHAAAVQLASRAWELAIVQQFEKDFIRAARLQGAALVGVNDLARADERLHHALTRARAVNLVEEELPALIALAELRRRHGDSDAARELLDAVWESAERGPYPLYHADALNVLAQIERDAGNTAAAIEAATQAYRKAWCDGPPFAYHWGLEAARAHLNALGAPEPSDLPPYDESQHEPMPEVEIDPPDLPVESNSIED